MDTTQRKPRVAFPRRQPNGSVIKQNESTMEEMKRKRIVELLLALLIIAIILYIAFKWNTYLGVATSYKELFISNGMTVIYAIAFYLILDTPALVVTRDIAREKNRNVYGWLFICLFANYYTLFMLWRSPMLPKRQPNAINQKVGTR